MTGAADPSELTDSQLADLVLAEPALSPVHRELAERLLAAGEELEHMERELRRLHQNLEDGAWPQ